MVEELLKTMKPATLDLLKKATTTKETLAVTEEVHDILMGKILPPAPPAPPMPSKSEEKIKQKGKSQDKPDKEAGEGDGDGERDHKESTPGENGKGEQKDQDDTKGDGDGGSADADEATSAPKKSKDKNEKKEEEQDEEDDADADVDGDPSGEDDKNPDEDDADEDDADEDDADADASSEMDDSDGEDDASGKDEGQENEAEEDGADGSADDSDEENDPARDESSDDGDDDDDDEGGRRNEVSSVITAGDEGGGVGEVDGGSEEEHQGGGGGVGNESAKSMFDYEDGDFDEVDTSSQIAIKISDAAVAAMNDPKQYLVFTRELDEIKPVEVPDNMNSKWVPEMEDQTRLMTSKMQKDIERIMASQSHVIRTPGHRTGKLHAPSLFRVPGGDPRVFTQKQEHVSKDTAVSVVIDNSGSMGGQKMDLAMTAGYALCSTLDRVKIAHEVIGFTTGGWYGMPQSMRDAMAEEARKARIGWDRTTPIVMPIYKTYDERLTATVKARFAFMKKAQPGLNGNIDGESLEYAAERLLKRMEKRKVMLVLSDGQPAGGHKSGPHLAAVVKQLGKMGIECIGIGIMDDSVSKYYPKFTVLRKAEDLPGQVMTEIKKILLGI
jgi:hypothetical protein